jgi:hypothetical protein
LDKKGDMDLDPYDDPYDPYKVCPECGGEYQDTAAVCADCEVPLVLPEQIEERDARELPLTSRLVLLCTAPIQWIRALAADLAQAGIGYAIDRRKARSDRLLSLYVRREDRQAAVVLDATRMRIDPLETELEPEEELREDVAPEPDHMVCPKCGGEYRLEILRCPDCDVDLKTALTERQAAEEPEELYDELPTEEEEQSAFVMPLPPRHEIPASDDLVCLCCGALSELAGLWPALDDAGIGQRIESAPYKRNTADCCLYLRPEDCDAAERIWKAVSPTDESSAPEERTCPACGASLLTKAPDCPDCGLSITFAADASCTHCGAIAIGLAGRLCPNCGVAVAEE